MPFLKKSRRVVPLRTENEKKSLKSGLRHAVFSVAGDKYIGEWKLNNKYGKGREEICSAYQYEGDWKDGYWHGYGVLSTKLDDDTYYTNYIGEWQMGQKQGKGLSQYDDGSYYEGYWVEGSREGYGRMWFPDGSFYEGEWLNDEFNGLGMLVSENGNRYEGEWKSGVKHGRGIYYHLDSGQKQEGVWDRGVAVCSILTDIDYRQSALYPTPYPIKKLEVEEIEQLFHEKVNEILGKQKKMKTATRKILKYGQKEIKNKCKAIRAELCKTG